MADMNMDVIRVLLFSPNVIGYIRFGLSLLCFIGPAYQEHPYLFLRLSTDTALIALIRVSLCFSLYGVAVALDYVDGLFAKVFDQRSSFGAFLDVLLDVIHRGLLWCRVAPDYGPWISALEWTCFVTTTCIQSHHWKQVQADMPYIVATVMANGLHNPIGNFVAVSINCLPMWIYVNNRLPDSVMALPMIGIALAMGRVLGGVCELWYVARHCHKLLSADALLLQNKRKEKQ